MTSHQAPSTSSSSSRPDKQPRVVVTETVENHSHTIFAFPPNRDTLGGTAYLIVESVNILVDCPAWDETTQSFLEQQGSIHWLFLTQRGSIGKAHEIQNALGCRILIQEQEAYLLPGADTTTFEHSFVLTPQTRAIWTSGHSPGAACLYHSGFGGVLFTGRHLLPNPQGVLMPIKQSKTFHWPRQVKNTQRLLDEFTPDTLQLICPGANLGFLRGKYGMDNGYDRLHQAVNAAVSPLGDA